MTVQPTLGKQIRMSPPLGMDYWEYLQKTGRFTLDPRLVLREREPERKYRELIPKLQTLTSQFLDCILGHVQGQEKPSEAFERLRLELDQKYKHHVMGLYYRAVGDAGAGDPSNTMALCQAMDIHNDMLSESWGKEYPDKPNPFSYLAEMFELGIWPKGFRVADEVERFLVDVPLTLKQDAQDPDGVVMLGCWADGDTDIYYIHSFGDDCRFNINLYDERPERVIKKEELSFFTHIPPLVTI